MPEVWFDLGGVHTWEHREYEWCVSCFDRACDEGMAVCHMCAAEKHNP